MENSLIIEYLEDRFYSNNRFMNEGKNGREYFPHTIILGSGKKAVLNKERTGYIVPNTRIKISMVDMLNWLNKQGISDEKMKDAYFNNQKLEKLALKVPNTVTLKTGRNSTITLAKRGSIYSNGDQRLTMEQVRDAWYKQQPNEIVGIDSIANPTSITLPGGTKLGYQGDGKYVSGTGQTYDQSKGELTDIYNASIERKQKAINSLNNKPRKYKRDKSYDRKTNGRVGGLTTEGEPEENVELTIEDLKLKYYEDPDKNLYKKLYKSNTPMYYIVTENNVILFSLDDSFNSSTVIKFLERTYGKIKPEKVGYIVNDIFFPGPDGDMVLYPLSSKTTISNIKTVLDRLKNRFGLGDSSTKEWDKFTRFAKEAYTEGWGKSLSYTSFIRNEYKDQTLSGPGYSNSSYGIKIPSKGKIIKRDPKTLGDIIANQSKYPDYSSNINGQFVNTFSDRMRRRGVDAKSNLELDAKERANFGKAPKNPDRVYFGTVIKRLENLGDAEDKILAQYIKTCVKMLDDLFKDKVLSNGYYKLAYEKLGKIYTDKDELAIFHGYLIKLRDSGIKTSTIDAAYTDLTDSQRDLLNKAFLYMAPTEIQKLSKKCKELIERLNNKGIFNKLSPGYYEKAYKILLNIFNAKKKGALNDNQIIIRLKAYINVLNSIDRGDLIASRLRDIKW